jgi:uncharacterized membrane protein
MDENSRMQSRDAGRGGSRSGRAKWAAVIGGAGLAVYGITRRSPLGMALAASGGTLALVSATQKRNTQPLASTSLLINCSPHEAYRFWRDFQNLPRFMNRLQSVSVLDDRRSRWVAIGPGGKTVQWDAEITDERENEYIAWRSLPGSDIQSEGRVEFKEAPAGRGTLVSVRLEMRPAQGMRSSTAGFFNRGASFALRQEMRRLEALIEAGEIPTIEGQPHGRRDLVTVAMRVADPTRPIPPGSNLKDVFTEKRRMA